MSQKSEHRSTAEEDAFLILYDQVKEKWLINDPYMRDPDGFMAEINKLWDEHEEEQKKAQEAKARELEAWFNTPWRKTLQELAPRYKGIRLEDRIYNEILIKGEQFTPEKASEYDDSIELWIRLRAAQQNFNEKVGEYQDMFGVYLMENERLTGIGQCLTPMNVVKFMTRCVIVNDKDFEVVKSWCDPACGTGRFMLGCAEYYREKIGKDNYIFFNQDIDFKMYVFTAINAILHDIPSITVLGDSLAFEKREAIITIPLAPGFTPWKIIKENIHEAEAALLAGIDKLATQV